MWLAWIWVLGFGVIPYLLLYFLPLKRMPGIITENIYNLGVALITARSIYKGVIIIYNTTNEPIVATYTVLSIVFLTLGAISFALGLFFSKKEQE